MYLIIFQCIPIIRKESSFYNSIPVINPINKGINNIVNNIPNITPNNIPNIIPNISPNKPEINHKYTIPIISPV